MIKTNSNSIQFGGTLGKDLEIKGGQNGSKPFGVVTCAQTTSWPDGHGGFKERTTWMNLKFNDYMLNKIQRNGGLYKGDELVIDGYLVQRKVGQEQGGQSGYIITEIQVEEIVSHMPKSLKDLAKQAGLNHPAQPQRSYQAPAQNNYNPNARQPQQPQGHTGFPSNQHHQPQHHQPQQPQGQWDESVDFYQDQ